MDNIKISDKTKLLIVLAIALFEIAFIQFNKDKPRIQEVATNIQFIKVTESEEIVKNEMDVLVIGSDFPIINEEKVRTNEVSDENKTLDEATDEKVLEVHYLDVGQADAVYIGYGSFDMVIDAGNNEDGPYVVDYLHTQGVDTIELMIASHAHEDHIGGLDDVLENFAVKTIIDSGEVKDTKTYRDYMKAAKANGAVILEDDSRTFRIDDALSIEIIEAVDNNENTNNNSIIVRVQYGEVSFLFTGDLEEDIEKTLLTKNIEANVFKAGHHGSSTSNSDMFMRRVRPEIVIISAGANNKYGHPHGEALARLKKHTDQLFGTWENGDIIVSTDGESIFVDADEMVTMDDAAAGGKINKTSSNDNKMTTSNKTWWQHYIKPSKIDIKKEIEKEIKKELKKEIIKEATQIIIEFQ